MALRGSQEGGQGGRLAMPIAVRNPRDCSQARANVDVAHAGCAIASQSTAAVALRIRPYPDTPGSFERPADTRATRVGQARVNRNDAPCGSSSEIASEYKRSRFPT